MFHVGTEAEIKAGDKTYKLSRLDRAIMHQFEAYAHTKLSKDVSALIPIVKDLSPDVQREVVSKILDANSVKPFFHDDVQAIMATPEGTSQLLKLLLAKHHPEVSEEETWNIMMAVAEGEISKSVTQASGQLPPEEKGVPGDSFRSE